jgi:hypothetical protein
VSDFLSTEGGPVGIRARQAVADDRKLLEYLWAGEADYFTLNFPEARHFRKPEVWDHLASALYFGVLPRTRGRGRSADVARQSSVAWVDVDDPAGVSRVSALLSHDLRPSVVVRSTSGGCHAYWKLSRPILTDDVERNNRALARHLGGDDHWPRTSSMRLPGRSKPRGQPTKIVGGTWSGVDPSPLLAMADAFEPATTSDVGHGVHALPRGDGKLAEPQELAGPVRRAESALGVTDRIYLKDEWLEYIRLRPQRGWANPDEAVKDRSRSAKEFSMIMSLLRGGWSDAEILGLAQDVGLARQSEEFERRGDWTYTKKAIVRARERLVSHGVTFDVATGRAHAPVDRDTKAGKGGYHWISDYDVLKLCRGQSQADVVREATELGYGRRSALNAKVNALRASGYLDHANELTDRGREVLEPGRWQRLSDGVLTQRAIREGKRDQRRLR